MGKEARYGKVCCHHRPWIRQLGQGNRPGTGLAAGRGMLWPQHGGKSGRRGRHPAGGSGDGGWDGFFQREPHVYGQRYFAGYDHAGGYGHSRTESSHPTTGRKEQLCDHRALRWLCAARPWELLQYFHLCALWSAAAPHYGPIWVFSQAGGALCQTHWPPTA